MPETLQQFGKLVINLYETPDEESGHVVVDMSIEDGKTLKGLVLTSAFLAHTIAQKSNLGYEKALEMITEKTMTYKLVGCTKR